ncbi:TonB-dependent receptor [Thauera sinica]|uniref:TonB-dependent receptor n=1 Tax=Thauera sinica TaxID=2665146 RepID=A0ABW1AKG0_9RHOO|nr:TonB-dependent receptor [Thauera sp. K11]
MKPRPRSTRLPLAAALLAAFPLHAAAQSAGDATVLSTVVVTAQRAEAPLEETPQRVLVIDREDIERTPSRELTDVLKKNAGLDVIQYPGNLSGIGIRGFTPEFSGINKRSLLLIDGRPAMSTNLSIVDMNRVEHIEVLKGPASALYGSSAMGGVVNVITRESRGPLTGSAEVAAGSFDLRELKGHLGGKLGEAFDFDYSGSWFDQDDYKTGKGHELPTSAYEQQFHALRLGLDLNADWRVNASFNTYRGRDIGTPDDVAYADPARTTKDMDHDGLDLRLSGRIGAHRLSATVFSGREYSEYVAHGSPWYNPALLPRSSFAEETEWQGWQLQHQWEWAQDARLVWGIDHERAKVTGKSWDLYVTGARNAPYSADNEREATGIYVENTWTFNGGDTTVNAGIRRDDIRVKTLGTPLKTNFTPTTSDFDTVNPSIGFKHLLGAGFRVHGTAGRAFVPPTAAEFTGEATSINWQGKTEITRGNANLKPESSVTVDLGLEWSGNGLYLDATVFDTRVKDKITRDGGTAIDADTTLFTYINANRARMRGLELEGRWQIRPGLGLTAGLTHMFAARQEIGSDWVDLNKVARQNAHLALDVDHGAWSARVGGRYVGRSKDLDWVNSSGTQVGYAGYTVWDVAARYRFDARQSVALSIDNVFDRYYAEKYGFPQPGRAARLAYRYAF